MSLPYTEEMLESIGYMGGSTVQIIGMEEF